VRTKDGSVGWVLARNLYMSVPDDVAQYAEGKRITAYLALGDVRDGNEVKQQLAVDHRGQQSEDR